MSSDPATPAWIPVRTDDGSFTLAHPLHGQACHSRAGAWEESRLRYAAACRLAERARLEARLALLDVGTGLGLNLAAALEAVRGTGCRLEVLTLELDPSVLEAARLLFAREEAALAPALRSSWAAALAALRAARERGAAVEWEGGSLTLALGDARATLPAQIASRFDAVFLDAFSPGVEPALWSPEFLRELGVRMAPGSLLSTYSTALAVRAGLVAAGLRVGVGARVGSKAAGTLASPDLDLGPLEPRLERKLWRRAESLRQGIPPRPGNSPATVD